MGSTVVWVLTFTILGATPEHKTFAKYKTKQECEQALEQSKAEYNTKKKSIVGFCAMTIK